MSAAQHNASAVLAELITLGVEHVIVAPGSRSQALALAAADAETAGLISVHVRIDERAAAFTALGIARETGIPAPVIVTSGSAVANLLPAVTEAHHARIPMLLLTADRPAELRGIRASQTMSDRAFMTPFCRWVKDASADLTPDDMHPLAAAAFAASVGQSGTQIAGPAHMNIALRDPLSEHPTGVREAVRARLDAGNPGVYTPAPFRGGSTYVHGSDAPPSVVIAGADAGAEAEAFAHAARLPLLAEPSSGARFGREAIQHWEELLTASEPGGRTGRAIVFGHPTLTRTVPRLISEGLETVVIDRAAEAEGIEVFNPGGAVKGVATHADVADDYDPTRANEWLGTWVTLDRELRERFTTVHAPDLAQATQQGYKERSAYARQEVARLREPVTREHLSEMLWLATWPHDRLVVASSRLIRVLNRQAAPRNIHVHANRGLAGIDGTIATAMGVALASQHGDVSRATAGTTRVLLGDLAFLHDVGSLVHPPADEPLPRIQLVVGNDGGGTIFDTLEVAGTTPSTEFDRVMYTPHESDLHAIATAHGWGYRLVTNKGELERAFTTPVTGPEVLEVTIQR